MKKMLMLLSLIVIALFVVSCAPKEGDDGGAIAGQATGVKYSSCTDSDGGIKKYIPGYTLGVTDKRVKKVVFDGVSPSGAIMERKCIYNTPASSQSGCEGGTVSAEIIVPETKEKNLAWACKCITDDQCGAGYICKDSACATKTCTVGYTGKGKCKVDESTNHMSYWFEYQYADCKITNSNGQDCEYGIINNETKQSETCMDNKGCCLLKEGVC